MTNVDNPLGRIRRHDPRSRRYAVSAAPAPGKSVRHSMNAPNVDQFYLGACFPPGTLVRMADGSELPIEDIRLGEYVATAEGNTGRVVRSLLRDESEGLLRIIAIGHSHLRATAEHPILTSHGYVPAQDLVRGDEIAFPRYRSEMVTAAIDTSRYINKPSHRLPSNRRWTGPVWAKAPSKRGSSNVSIPEKIELDHKFGRFIGLFLAEGHCGEYTATFTFADHELHTLAAEVVDTASELGVSAHVRVNTARHTTIVTIHSVGWSRLLSTLCGNGSGMKEPHRDLAAGSDEFLSGMLEGWLDGDGHHRKDGARQGVTVSRKLAMSMYDIGQVLERHPVIAYSRPTNNRDKSIRQPRWDVTFSPTTYARMDDRHVWRKLRNTQREPYSGPVYDLTVEGDHSYVAEGIGVHNCVGFSGTNMLNCSMAVRSRAKFNSIVKYGKAGTTYLGNNDGIENYHQATVYDPWPGEYPPTDEGSSAIGLMTWWKQVGVITGYDWAFTFDQFLAALQRQPVLVGTEWFNDMMEPDDVGVLHPGGRSAGGHEYLATQINWPRRHIGFENSWGEAWGIGGRFYMTFDDFKALLAEGGDAVAPRFL
jgi:hypothetical protein